MDSEIQKLYELVQPIGFIMQDNKLNGPDGTVIEYFKRYNTFFVKKYPNKDYSGKPVIWGKNKGLNYENTIDVLKQIFLYIDW